MSSRKSSNDSEAVCWLKDECLPDIPSLLDSPLPGSMPATPVTDGSMNSRFTLFQSSQLSSSTDIPSQRNGTASTDPDEKMVDRSERMHASLRWLDVRYFPEITLLDVTRESEVSHEGESFSMEVTQGGVLENNSPSLELSGSHMVKIQTSAEETFDNHSFNVPQNIHSSSNASVQCAASQFSTSDMQCNTSSNNVTLELHSEPLLTSSAVEANNEEPLTSLDAEFTSKETQPSPETTGSVNSTVTFLQPSQLISSINESATAQIPCPQNTTLDLPPCNVKPPETESKATDPATSVSKNTTETSLVMNPTSSDMQNATIDGHSLYKPSGNTFLGDAGAAIICLQNNTFDPKPKQNDTMTFSETSGSDRCRKTFDNSTPPEFCNSTSSPKEINSEAQNKGTLSSTGPNTKMIDTPESTFEGNPAVEGAFGAGQRETRDQSQSGLSFTDGLSSTLGHQNMDVEDNANPFNMDDTLDLKADSLITSTPMTTCKMLSIHIQEGKTRVGQRKLDGHGASKPDGQSPSGVPSNIACERKMSLAHQAAKSRLPPPRSASQLLRHKPASILSGRFDALTSGLPMTRQRTQALRNPAAPNAPQTSGIPCLYKLRASTTATNPTTPSQTKQPLSRSVLAVTKRKKMDAAVPASTAAETATSSRARSLKRPASSHKALLMKAKGHDCANCVLLEQQLKMQSEKMQRLQELLKEKNKF